MAPSQPAKQNNGNSIRNGNNHEASVNGESRNYSNSNGNNGQHTHQAHHSQSRRSGQAGAGSIMMNSHSNQQQPQYHHGNIGSSQSNRQFIPSQQQQQQQQQQPTPLFERLVTEEVQELKAYARIIENQSRRLAELEKIHSDLEVRLEVESRGRAQLEATLEQREREWAMKFQGLETDRDQWKNEVTKEKEKNAKLIDQVVRKDQDIHRMLQRKYDNHRESATTQSMRNSRLHNTSERQSTPPKEAQEGTPTQQLNKSPHEILAASGSMETVRIRNVQNLLGDFFSG